MKVAVYDTKPYDRQYLGALGEGIEWHFHEFRLDQQTSGTASQMDAVCVFVNDKVDGECVQKLRALGVKLIALRCAGFNNVDLAAAKAAEVSRFAVISISRLKVGRVIAMTIKSHAIEFRTTHDPAWLACVGRLRLDRMRSI